MSGSSVSSVAAAAAVAIKRVHEWVKVFKLNAFAIKLNTVDKKLQLPFYEILQSKPNMLKNGLCHFMAKQRKSALLNMNSLSILELLNCGKSILCTFCIFEKILAVIAGC